MRRRLVIHPFLCAVFPPLFLLAANVRQFELSVLVLPMVFLLVATALLWGLLTLLLKNARKAGILVSVFLLLFFTYGYLYRGLPYFRVRFWKVRFDVRHVSFGIYGVLMLVAGWFTVRTKRDLRALTQIVNVFAAVLVAFSVVNIGVYHVRAWLSPQQTRTRADDVDVETPTGEIEKLPDVYHIILDGYGRDDILRELYGHDNSDFLDELRKRGFTIASKSTSNYAHTLLCFTAALNMNYIQTLLPDADPTSDDLTPLIDMMRHSEVHRILKKHGYTTMAFATGYMVTDMIDADVFVAAGLFEGEFNNALLDMTPVWMFVQKLSRIPLHRQRLLNTFERVKTLAAKPCHKFVHVHFVCPHDPFVFGPNGEEIDPPSLNQIPEPFLTAALLEEYRACYRNQVIYLNRRVLDMLDAVIERSPRDVVIVMQGDHGPPSSLKSQRGELPGVAYRERFSILNAYRLPGKDPERIGIYQDISPVNSFRVIMNAYFGTDYKPLENRSYMSGWNKLYNLREVTDKVRPQATPAGGAP